MTEKIKVLVVEDEEIIGKALKTKLEKNNYLIIVAVNGASGVESAIKEKPDIILLDLIMPKMSGFEVLTKLKSDPNTENIPVVILSNLDDSSYIKKAADEGAISYLIKTQTNLDEIKNKIREITKK